MRRMRSTRHPFLLETVWMDKWRFDEAERLFQEAGQRRPEAGVGPSARDGAGKRRQEKCAPRCRPVVAREADRHWVEEAAGEAGTVARKQRPAVACHHLVAGVWINRGAFDQAELQFLTRSQARAVPRSLPIPKSPRPTPDEGYGSVGATPVTPATPGPRGNRTSPSAGVYHPPAREVWLEQPRPTPDDGYGSVGATPVTPDTPGRRGNGMSPSLPIRPPAREVWLEKPWPTPGEGHASVGTTSVTPATPEPRGNGMSPSLPIRPPAREVLLEKPWPTPDEGYASVGTTSVTPATPEPRGNGMSPSLPIRPPAREVLLEKPWPTPDEGYASVGTTSVTPATPEPRGNGMSPSLPIRPPAREVLLEKPWPTPDEGYASVGTTSVTPATPEPRGNGMSPSLPIRPPAREVLLEKPWPTPDEGYASVGTTPVTPATPGPRENGTSPSAGVYHPPACVWLEKPLYDEAERLYHEGRAAQRDGPHQSGTTPPPPLAMDPGPSPTPAHRHLVHQDNEPVWFNKPAHDAAELHRHLLDARGMPGKTHELSSASPPAPPTERSTPAPRCPRTQDKTMAVNMLANENIWFDKYKYDDAELKYYSQMHGSVPTNTPVQNTAQNPPATQSAVQGADGELCSRVTTLEKENLGLHKEVEQLRLTLSKLEIRLATVEKSLGGSMPALCPPAQTRAQPAAQQPVEDGDDEIDLFGSSDDEAASRESERVREERVRQYAAKKSSKPALVAKSSILLDVKPWDDETDMGRLEECVRTVQINGLLWGASKLVPVGYGIMKLQIQCVVEDDKVGTDQLEEEITKFEDYVQSVDVAAFNKV
ncbi:eukaryotic translation elongation factor 1 delta b (guanine nucleotide exchange protein) isoform X2 [Rhinoraja longicauda]